MRYATPCSAVARASSTCSRDGVRANSTLAQALADPTDMLRPSVHESTAVGAVLQTRPTRRNADVNGDGVVSRDEFRKAVRTQYNFSVSDESIHRIFDEIDYDQARRRLSSPPTPRAPHKTES
jgi:hypothetical protein